MIRTMEEIITAVNGLIPEDEASDEQLAVLEDLTDTLTDLTTRAADQTDWQSRYEALDAEWRKKYRDRFLGSDEDPEEEEEEPEENDAPVKYEDLFEEVKEG